MLELQWEQSKNNTDILNKTEKILADARAWKWKWRATPYLELLIRMNDLEGVLDLISSLDESWADVLPIESTSKLVRSLKGASSQDWLLALQRIQVPEVPKGLPSSLVGLLSSEDGLFLFADEFGQKNAKLLSANLAINNIRCAVEHAASSDIRAYFKFDSEKKAWSLIGPDRKEICFGRVADRNFSEEPLAKIRAFISHRKTPTSPAEISTAHDAEIIIQNTENMLHRRYIIEITKIESETKINDFDISINFLTDAIRNNLELLIRNNIGKQKLMNDGFTIFRYLSAGPFRNKTNHTWEISIFEGMLPYAIEVLSSHPNRQIYWDNWIIFWEFIDCPLQIPVPKFMELLEIDSSPYPGQRILTEILEGFRQKGHWEHLVRAYEPELTELMSEMELLISEKRKIEARSYVGLIAPYLIVAKLQLQHPVQAANLFKECRQRNLPIAMEYMIQEYANKFGFPDFPIL